MTTPVRLSIRFVTPPGGSVRAECPLCSPTTLWGPLLNDLLVHLQDAHQFRLLATNGTHTIGIVESSEKGVSNERQ